MPTVPISYEYVTSSWKYASSAGLMTVPRWYHNTHTPTFSCMEHISQPYYLLSYSVSSFGGRCHATRGFLEIYKHHAMSINFLAATDLTRSQSTMVHRTIDMISVVCFGSGNDSTIAVQSERKIHTLEENARSVQIHAQSMRD